MRVMNLMLATSTAFIVAGCSATVSEDFSYATTSERALVVFDSSIVPDNYFLILAPIDEDTNEFIRMPAQFLAGSGNQTEENPTGRTYYVEQLEPGRYVLAGMRASYPPRTICYSQGAPIYNFEAGVANVISQPGMQLGTVSIIFEGEAEASDPAFRLSQAEASLAKVAGIASDVPARLVESEGMVTFRPGARLVGPGCPGASTFERAEES